MSVNKAILVGRLGRDPETRYLDQNVATTTFSIATSETYKKDGERFEKTEWHNIVTWRGLAEVAAKYLKKGSQVYVEGKIRTRSWDDKDGNKRYTTEIVADEMRMLDPKGEGNPNSAQAGAQPSGNQNVSQPAKPAAAPVDDIDDDLPF